MMNDYLKYWQAREPLFLSPLPQPEKQLFCPEALQPGLARLGQLSAAPQALVIMTGESGLGKTTVLRWLVGTLPVASHEAMLVTLVRREAQAGWLVGALLTLLGASSAAASFQARLQAVAGRLEELANSGRRLILCIDNAHLASGVGALDEVTALISLQALAGTTLTVVLCGEPALARQIDTTLTLAEAPAFKIPLMALTQAETADYLQHRLQLAGVDTSFAPKAVDLIHQRCRGVYGQINAYAESCMMEAAFKQATRITPEVAFSAAAYLGAGAIVEPTPSPVIRLSSLFKAGADGS